MLIQVFFFAICSQIGVKSTPLDDYVNTPDPHYKYDLIKTYQLDGYNLYILNMTSQKWYDETVLDKPIWWHFLCVTIPFNVTKPDAGFLFIEGGHNDPNMQPPPPTDNFVRLTSIFAVSTGAIGATLKQIPNQPIVFKKDPTQKRRSEDDVIAWTWKTFIENTSDPYILLRMPMTKAAVRAMDTITDFARKKGVADIEKFMVAGASKRGWTTWTTAAVDNKRVFAAVPIVMDLLNLNTNLHHHYRSLGGWTFAFDSYYQLNITKDMDTPEFFAMQRIVDPFYYLERYTNTKLMLINSAGDEFFVPDDPDYFWSNLLEATDGTCMLRRLPNAEHSCAGHEISMFFSMRSFFLSVYYVTTTLFSKTKYFLIKPYFILKKIQLPIVTWSRPNNFTHGITVARVDIANGPMPSDIQVYYAQTLDNKRRDFRLVIADSNDPNKPVPHPVLWKSDTKLIETEVTKTYLKYTVAFPKPLSGWLGFYFQLSFPGPDETTLEISTEINIIPETFPFEDCFKETCFGTLV